MTWIEQLASKRNSVGADKVVAVSSSGFSEPATKQAKSYGIEIRRVEDITRSDFTDWIPTEFSEHFERTSIVFGFSYGVHPNQIKSISKKFIAKTTSEKGVDIKCFTYKPTGQKFSAMDIWKMHIQASADSIFQDVPLDNTPVQRYIQFYFPDSENRFCIPGKKGLIDVFDIIYTVELSIQVATVPLAKLLSYSSTNDELIRGVEYKLDNIIMSLNKDIQSGRLYVHSKVEKDRIIGNVNLKVIRNGEEIIIAPDDQGRKGNSVNGVLTVDWQSEK